MARPNSKAFTDSAGDAWSLKINFGTCRAVKDECGVDLLEATRGKFEVLEDVVGDPYTLGSVLWVLCREQAEGRNLGEPQFAERFADADVVEDAAAALLYGLIDFFPRRVRPQLERALQMVRTKFETRQTLELERTSQELDSPRLAAQIDALIDTAFSTSVRNSPGSSASIPIPSP